MKIQEPPGHIKQRMLHTILLLYVLIGATAMWIAGRFDVGTTIYLLSGTLVAGVVVWWKDYR